MNHCHYCGKDKADVTIAVPHSFCPDCARRAFEIAGEMIERRDIDPSCSCVQCRNFREQIAAILGDFGKREVQP